MYCKHCGTKQTLPRLDDDRRANLYDRANHFRRNNEFDKAMGIYERILNEDKTDAESYWSLVLCRYGIEYVEDPATHKRVPTVNRAQFTSIFDDDNYKSAIQYADGYQRSIYEAEAKAINEIQKGILAISQKEEPFDVFICYKESDNNGRRTPDSVLANDLYHQLTQEGFKVFFSRITLEDKLGSAYEPYIFAALNSAKVMVVLGTRPEYFNAVWVKNEWSRYLSLIKQGQKKMLIPAYKDMDPYDLPEEFSHLQAQDMSKLGFMQDLIRGIKKITQTEAPVAVVEAPVVATVGSSNVDALLERGNMALEDGEWDKAMGFFEDVLNNDARNAAAYLGETLAQEKCCTMDALVRKRRDVYQKASVETLEIPERTAYISGKVEKFALPGYLEAGYLRTLYDVDRTYDSEVSGRKQQYQDEINWWESHKLLSRAEKFAVGTIAETLHREKKHLFDQLKDRITQAEQADATTVAEMEQEYDSFLTETDAQAEKLYQDALARREQDYQTWVAQAKTENDVWKLRDLAQHFASLNGYADSKALGEYCHNRADEEQAKIDAEKERLAEARRKEAERIAKRNKRIAVICTSVAAVALAVILVVTKIIVPNAKYNDAVALMDAGNLDEAYSAFQEIGNYKDALDKAATVRLTKNMEHLKTAMVGDYVIWGSYEQDNNKANGKEDIEWLVLEIKDGKALVISKYALDCQQYNTERTSVTWETCSLRQWLNKDFLNAAFSAEEQAMIPTVTVPADKNPSYSTDPGKATQDKVSLLSIQEANKYFSSDSARQCAATDYAVANGAYVNSDNGNCWWWLRSPGLYQFLAAYVRSGGGLVESGDYVNGSDDAVRPALWINLDS